MIAGFTGTQHGMSMRQFGKLQWVFRERSITEFHHGDCIGADAGANRVARQFHIKTAGHPPLYDKKRAFCECDIWFPPMSYLDRNHAIVDICDVLLVAPLTNQEQVRSGTWATWRYATNLGREIIMLER